MLTNIQEGQLGFFLFSTASYAQSLGGTDFELLKPGDCNYDSKVDIADAIYLQRHLFGGGPAPVAHEGMVILDGEVNPIADVNDDEAIDIADVIKIGHWIISQSQFIFFAFPTRLQGWHPKSVILEL